MKKTVLISTPILGLALVNVALAGDYNKDKTAMDESMPKTESSMHTMKESMKTDEDGNAIIESAEEDQGQLVPDVDSSDTDDLNTASDETKEGANAITAEAQEDRGELVPDTDMSTGENVGMSDEDMSGEPNEIVEEARDDRGRLVPETDGSS